MSTFKNEKGNPVLMKMVNAIHENKDYLGEVDGLIGDGDHGMNMNKGFMLFGKQYGDKSFTFAEGLSILVTFFSHRLAVPWDQFMEPFSWTVPMREWSLKR